MEKLRNVWKKKASIRAVVDKLPYSDLSLDGWNGDALKEKFDSPLGGALQTVSCMWNMYFCMSYMPVLRY